MRNRDWSLLLLLSLLWGGSFFFVEVALRDLAPLTLVTARLLLGTVLLAMLLAAQRTPLSLRPGTLGALMVMGVLNCALPFTLFAWAQQSITGGLAAILNATTPIWVVLLAHHVTADEKLTRAKLLGVVVAFLGVVLMIGLELVQSGLSSGLTAQLACLGAAVSYASAGLWGRRFKRLGLDTTVTACGQLLGATLVMVPLTLFVGTGDLGAVGTASWIAVLALAGLSTALAYVIYFRLLATAGATNLLLVTFLIPVSALLLGALFLGEAVNGQKLAGMALIAFGLLVIDGRLPALTPAPRTRRSGNPRH